MGQLDGRTGLIFGIANHRSIAWAIAQAADAEGASLVLTYEGERVERFVRDLAPKLSRPPLILQCDVTNDEQIAALYAQIAAERPVLDFLVHSVAFANRDDLDGRFIDTSREGFHLALEVSAYSLTAVTRGALPLLRPGSGVLTMTYLGSQRAVPHYNVMGVAKAALEASVRYLAADLGTQGIRVNAVSAGPVATLSSRAIAGFGQFAGTIGERTALGRNAEVAEIARTAVFLAGPGAAGITGQVIYVDGGFNIMGA